ncbi:hypothetical protein N9O24_00450 [bacterium]|nr:hypothetical protein [bacterium]
MFHIQKRAGTSRETRKKNSSPTPATYGNRVHNTESFQRDEWNVSKSESNHVPSVQLQLLETSNAAFIVRRKHRSASTNKLISVYIGLFIILLDCFFFGLCTDRAKPILYDGTTNSVSIVSGRIFNVLGLIGPHFLVDLACSVSLVVAHLATVCEQACIAAGCVLEKEIYAAFSVVAGMRSTRGCCHSCDSHAKGYCRRESCI